MTRFPAHAFLACVLCMVGCRVGFSHEAPDTGLDAMLPDTSPSDTGAMDGAPTDTTPSDTGADAATDTLMSMPDSTPVDTGADGMPPDATADATPDASSDASADASDGGFVECTGSDVCNFLCETPPCSFHCMDTSTCTVSCPGVNCMVACDPSATCTIDCGAGTCMMCGGGFGCLVSCRMGMCGT